MANIYKDIIVYKGRVGKLIEKKHNGNTIYRFYPAGYGSYYENDLEIVKNPEKEVIIADLDNGKEFAIKEFRKYNKDAEYIAISDKYQIIKDVDGKYHPHIKYKSTSRAFSTLESALLGMIIYDTANSEDLHLNKYIFKLLDIEW